MIRYKHISLLNDIVKTFYDILPQMYKMSKTVFTSGQKLFHFKTFLANFIKILQPWYWTSKIQSLHYMLSNCFYYSNELVLWGLHAYLYFPNLT